MPASTPSASAPSHSDSSTRSQLLFPRDDRLHLASLLEPHLPVALPLYNTLLTNEDLTYFATFDSSFPPPDRPWIILSGWTAQAQLRLFCSTESNPSHSSTELEQAEKLVVDVLREAIPLVAGDQTAFKVGAIHSLWFAAIERELHPAPFGPYDIHLSPPAARLPSSPRTLPSGIDRRAVQDSDIETVLSTSEVAHPVPYLQSRLSYSSALVDPSTSTLVAHCFLHRDGSLGTLHVDSAYRRQGLARAVVEDRLKSSSTRAFAYVGPTNAQSRALMKSLGWTQEWTVAWILFDLPLKGSVDAA